MAVTSRRLGICFAFLLDFGYVYFCEMFDIRRTKTGFSYSLSIIFWNVDLCMDRTVHSFWYADLHMYVDLSMDHMGLQLMSGIWVIYGRDAPYHIWNMFNIWIPESEWVVWLAERPGEQKSKKLFCP